MKVSELITKLQTLPQDAEVYVEMSGNDEGNKGPEGWEGDRCVRNAVDVGHFLGNNASVSICGAKFADCDYAATE